jgi:prolyl-tRNA editing enzyme YbaK/EbsC (Cys-tRNA(Pro) deacylase)
MSTEIIDTPIHRMSVEDLPDEQILSLIQQKRFNRMRAYNSYIEAANIAKAEHDKDLYILLQKTCEQLGKKLDAIDKALVAADKYVLKIISIRNELNLNQHIKEEGEKTHGS